MPASGSPASLQQVLAKPAQPARGAAPKPNRWRPACCRMGVVEGHFWRWQPGPSSARAGFPCDLDGRAQRGRLHGRHRAGTLSTHLPELIKGTLGNCSSDRPADAEEVRARPSASTTTARRGARPARVQSIWRLAEGTQRGGIEQGLEVVAALYAERAQARWIRICCSRSWREPRRWYRC